jgi:hypothetical protein
MAGVLRVCNPDDRGFHLEFNCRRDIAWDAFYFFPVWL